MGEVIANFRCLRMVKSEEVEIGGLRLILLFFLQVSVIGSRSKKTQ